VRGQGPVRTTYEAAERDLRADIYGCASQGGYTDRAIYEIDAEGYLVDPETGDNVYEGSGTNGAVRDVSRA